MIEAVSGGGLQVPTISGAATSPDEQLDSGEGWVVAVGLGMGDGLVSVNSQALIASRTKMCKRMEDQLFLEDLHPKKKLFFDLL